MNSVPSQGGGANLFNGLTAQQLAALSGVLGGQNAFSQSQITAMTTPGLSTPLNNTIVPVSQQQPVLPVQNAAHVTIENKSSIPGAAHNANGTASDTSLNSLPWPIVSPVMNVPHFDLSTYRLVNLDVAPSRDVNGFDLPLADVTTLRFFFNMGVQHSRSLAATQLYQEKLAHVVVSSAAANIAQPAQANLSQVLQLAGANILPSEAQVGGARTMDQYLNQLGIGSSQAHALLRQTQSHHLAQQAQLLAAAASVRLPERLHPSYGNSIIPLHADLLQMAAQGSVSASTSVPGGQLIRQPLFSNGNTGNPAIVSYSTASMNPHKQIPPNTAAAEQQAYYLQQALSAVASAQNEKSEVDVHVLQQQGSVGLHPYIRPASSEVLKPVAVGGGSQDAALSPRPPPVDPSPPRTLSDAGTNIVDSSASTLVHQQAQTSPPALREQCSQRRDTSQTVSTGRPQSARENGSSSSNVASRTTPQNSAPATPALTADDVVPVSQTLFHVSEQHFTEAFNASRKKSVSNPIGIAKCDFVSSAEEGSSKVSTENSGIPAPVEGADRKDLDDKPALAPILMMTYLSNCMSNIKSTLNTNGLPIGLDANGRAVDYSSRPIDPIFQQARARMENAREFRELSSPITLPQVSRSCFEEGFSPIGVALPTVSSTVQRSQTLTNPVGVNRSVSDTVPLEKDDENDDTDPPAEKRTKVADGD